MLKKTKIKLMFVCFFIVLLVGFILKETYSISNDMESLEDKEYTRKQMQEMVVSTALSLYYNSYFSDYGQYAMDNLGIPGNYFNLGNFLWRDLNITPESVGYSKYYHIDCSGYNFLIYKNTIGYDMSEYHTVNRFLIFNKEYEEDGEGYPIRRVSYFKNEQRLEKFREAYTKFGYGWNSGSLANMFRKAANNCGNSNCTQLKESESNVPYIYDNVDGHDENEVVYYFETQKPVSLDTVKSKYEIAEDALQPGDIIAYTKYDKSEDSTSGHVMFYVGDDIMTSSLGDNGFTDLLLHSTENGGGDYNSDENDINNKLYKKQSIIASSAENYVDGIDGKFDKAYGSKTDGSGDYILRFGIIRPLNTVCEKGKDLKYGQDDKCKISKNAFNVPLTNTKLNNNEARVVLKKTQVQQFMILEKEYNNQMNIESAAKDGYTRNIISEYNSVNVGDKIIYKLRLRNKFEQKFLNEIRIEAVIPENATYVSGSCSATYKTNNFSCKKEGNKIIWQNVEIFGIEEKNDITFSIVPKSEGVVEFKGYTIIKDNKVLQLDSRTINVEPTQNGINKEILVNVVNKFEKLVNEGQITYTNNENVTSEQNKKDLNTLSETLETSSLGYIKLMYYNAFGLNLDKLIETERILNTAQIRNAIFEVVKYPDYNNLNSIDISPEEKVPVVYAKKTLVDYNELSSLEKKISQMLVPGLYGGRHLKGNDNNDRIKFLRSYYNNNAYQSDLEIGDIIISYTINTIYDASNDKYTDKVSTVIYLYLGDDGKNGPILTRFTSDGHGNGLFLRHTDKYLDEYYDETSMYNGVLLRNNPANKPSNQILNELFSKDLFVVLRPSRLATTVEYDYNGGIKGTKSYVAYNTYKNLVVPKKQKYTVTLNYNNSNYLNEEIINNEFEGWYDNSYYTGEPITNDSVVKDSYHKLYAKWISTLLPKTHKNNISDYYIEGWYSDSDLKTKVGSGGDYYVPTENITLYAKWVKNELEIKNLKIKDNRIIYNLNYNDSYNDILENIVTNGMITIFDKNNNEKDINSSVSMYDTIRVKFIDDSVVEYKISILGDVNYNGKIDIADVAKAYQYLKRKFELDEINFLSIDITNDGKIEEDDIMELYLYLRENLN